jgi:formylglycine-generating enzyme required for sulfatase activity
VGSYRPNAFGLYDMHGNVWEWCQDCFGRYSASKCPLKDPVAATTGGSNRVFRGGSWYDYGRGCRSAFRDGRSPEHRYNNVGFRAAAVLSRE